MTARCRAAAVAVAFAAAAGCSPRDLVAVGAPGGVWRPDAGCATMEEGGGACPSGAQFTFETEERLFQIHTTTLASNLHVSCRRSHCGTGALTYSAQMTWLAGEPPPNSTRLTELRHVLPQPMDLAGKTLSASVFVERQGNQPMNAQLAVVVRGIFRRIDDGALRSTVWNLREGIIGPENPLWGSTTGGVQLVTEIRMQVYLATSVRHSSGAWSGTIWIDDIGWK